MTIRRLSATLAAGVLVGCGPALTPAPAPAPVPDAPVSVPVASAPRASRFALPASIPVNTMAVSLRATIERDSAGRTQRESIESAGNVTLTLRRDPRGLLRGSGRVEGFTTRAGGAIVGSTANVRAGTVTRPPGTPGSNTPLSVSLDIALDTLAARAVVQPALANECDRPEVAAASLARELLVRIPDSITVGDRWHDSLVSVVCRGGLPLTVRTTIESTLQGTNERNGTVHLDVRRTIVTRLEGESRSPWRAVSIIGGGTGEQRVRVDATRGTIVELDGESTLTITVTGGGAPTSAPTSVSASVPATQQVVQRMTLTARPTR